jgi:hypothetical protein
MGATLSSAAGENLDAVVFGQIRVCSRPLSCNAEQEYVCCKTMRRLGLGSSLEFVMRWLTLLLVLCAIELAWAEETPVLNDELLQEAVEGYERTIRRFNTHTERFRSWNAFKRAVLSRLPPGSIGNCYAQRSGSMQGVSVTRVKFQPVADGGWQQTQGHGWRKTGPKRTFVEYRFNQKAGVLLRIEGVKPRFFFARTTRICEFPLGK